MALTVARTGRTEDRKVNGDPASYDVIVIGSGPGGYVSAVRAGQLLVVMESMKMEHEVTATSSGFVRRIAMVALVILLQGHGNLKGMFVILAGGTAVAIQLIAAISRLD